MANCAFRHAHSFVVIALKRASALLPAAIAACATMLSAAAEAAARIAFIFAPSWSSASTHARKALRRDFVHDPLFTRLTERVFVLPEIFFCEQIDVRVGALLR